jgi:hypothetical protein
MKTWEFANANPLIIGWLGTRVFASSVLSAVGVEGLQDEAGKGVEAAASSQERFSFSIASRAFNSSISIAALTDRLSCSAKSEIRSRRSDGEYTVILSLSVAT